MVKGWLGNELIHSWEPLALAASEEGGQATASQGKHSGQVAGRLTKEGNEIFKPIWGTVALLP